VRSVVVAKFVPSPPNSGDKRRTLGILRALRGRGEVTLVAFAGEHEDVAPLEAEGITVVPVPLRRRPRDLVEGLVRGRSITSARFWDAELAAALARACRPAPDVLVVEHVQLLPAARGLHAGVRVVDMHNVESSLTARLAGSTRGPMGLLYAAEARALRRIERGLDDVDLVAVVSEGDRAALVEQGTHHDPVVVPNAWGEPDPLPEATDPVVSFVALQSWAPNVEAALWFTRTVWPHVLRAVPEARLQIVGREPAPEVQALAGSSVVVTGTVEDLTPWYAATRVAVAPLLTGGGSRLKILEALAAGRPVVSTAIGVEGLEDLVGRGVVVADEPAAMAAEVVELLGHPDRARAAGLAGAEAVGRDHSWAAAVAPLLARLPGRS
jgi:glycosyltransferase involved in cell wall biosynthesis